MFVVYTSLHHFAKYAPDFRDAPIAALKVITVNFPKLWEAVIDTNQASSRVISQTHASSEICDILCSRIVITIASTWPALLSEFPLDELQDLRRVNLNGNPIEPYLKFAAAVGVAIFEPSLLTAKLQNSASLMPLAFDCCRPAWFALWLFLYGVMARANQLEVAFVAELLRQIVNCYGSGLNSNHRESIRDILSTALLPLLGRYSAAVDCGAAWNLFWTVISEGWSVCQYYISDTIVDDLEVLLDALPFGVLADGRAELLDAFIRRIAHAWIPHWDRPRLIAVRDRMLAAVQPPANQSF
jgi:hypothetical protein